MNFGRVVGTYLAWLLIAALPSCAHERRTAERPPPVAAAPTPAEQSQGALQAAAQDQRELADQLKRLEDARNQVVAAQQQLRLAQTREEQERAKADQLQQRVSQRLQQANQRAAQAQAAAEQAQGIQNVAGYVLQATPSRVVLQAQSGQTYSFKVDPRTRVLVGTEQRSVDDIQQGADAQVAFDARADQPTALTIRVTPVGPQRSPATNPVEGPPLAPAR
jgi:hypothetical protein